MLKRKLKKIIIITRKNGFTISFKKRLSFVRKKYFSEKKALDKIKKLTLDAENASDRGDMSRAFVSWEKVCKAFEKIDLKIPQKVLSSFKNAGIKHAKEMCVNGKYSIAESILDKLLFYFPNNKSVLILSGEIAFVMGKWAKAIECCNKAYSNNDIFSKKAADIKHVASWKQSVKSIKNNNITYNYVLNSLNKERPGYGLDTNGSGPMDSPMAYGLIATAASIRYDVEIAALSADWLVENTASEDKIGWGLCREYDAFGNGLINPPDTVYGITTAFAVDGLISAYQKTGDLRYKSCAVDALEYYSAYLTWRGDCLFFWYSDQEHDSFADVHNVSAMLMGQYAHLAYLTGNDKFKKISEGAYKNLKTNMIVEHNYVYWNYAKGTKRTKPNDLIHASFIVYGLWKYSKYIEKNDDLLSKAGRYLDGFITDDGVFEYHCNYMPDKLVRKRARSWGVGMFLYVSSLLQKTKIRKKAIKFLPEYEFAEKKFSYQYGDKLHSPRPVAFLLLGLAPQNKRLLL